jgi:pseudouridine synthase
MSINGIDSRRKCELLIDKGLVKVNSHIVYDNVEVSEEDLVFFKNKELFFQFKKFYFAFYKPVGVVSSLSDEKQRTDLNFYISNIKKELKVNNFFSIGRLDKDSEGIILFTNDGDFSNFIQHPKFQIAKHYLVTTNKRFNSTIADLLKKTYIDGRLVSLKINDFKDNLLDITLFEGRKRIIRRLLEEHNFLVKSLVRVGIGNFYPKLKKGHFMKLSNEHLRLILGKNYDFLFKDSTNRK